MIGLIVTTNNKMSKVEYDPPHYDIIQKAVGGWYEHVHPIRLKRPYCMMVNEAGLLLNLPQNLLGSILYDSPQYGQPIVGAVIFLKEGYYDEGPAIVGMTEDEAQSLGDEFMKITGGIVRWAKKGDLYYGGKEEHPLQPLFGRAGGADRPPDGGHLHPEV